MMSCVATVLLFAQQNSSNSADDHSETKVSESLTNGKYKRISETFRGKVLIARKEEAGAHGDKTIDFVFTKLFRDGEMIYASTFEIAKKVTIRSYYHQGKMIMEEGDEDGDGFYETMILFDTNEQPVDAFEKNKDGTVRQFSAERLSKVKKDFLILNGNK